MYTPRPYLSFSQMSTFEMSPEKYLEQYIYGKKMRTTRNMAYGSQMADGLEAGEASGDPLLDLMMARLPKYELMDIAFEVDLPNGRTPIRLLAKPDSAKADYTAFYEYKTSVRKWTQKMADDSGQVTFYATAMWLKTGKIPASIELVDVVVAPQENGALQPTGDLWRFPTKRSMIDIIKMTMRMKKAWAGIQALCESELL